METTSQTSDENSDKTRASIKSSIESDHATSNNKFDGVSCQTVNGTSRGSSSEESSKNSADHSSKESTNTSNNESYDDVCSGLPTQSTIEHFETPSSLANAIYVQSADLSMATKEAMLHQLLNIFATYNSKNNGYLPGVNIDEKLILFRETDFPDVKDFMGILSYRLFFAMWFTWLGPSADNQSIPPPELMLKKWNDIYTGPMSLGEHAGDNADQIPLDEVIVEQLQLARGRFQKRCRFLLWALVRTDDEDLIALINLILVALHGLKAIHRGSGRLEIKSDLLEEFPPSIWDPEQQLLVPGVWEDEDEDEDENEGEQEPAKVAEENDA